MKKYPILILAIFSNLTLLAAQVDTINTHTIPEIVVRANSKETSTLEKVPSATTLITPLRLAERGISRVKQISSIVPNLFIADYGSPLSTPVYIRGVGTRGSGQSVGFYLDNVPILSQSTVDMDLLDISSISILRGPQGTLYGRNAMGGVINIATPSPLDYQGSKLEVGVGNYSTYSAKGSHYMKLGQRVGIGVAAHFNQNKGYFKNIYTNRNVDARDDAGARLKLDWMISDKWFVSLASSYEWTDGGAFAYGLYNPQTEVVAPVNYNDKGSYARQSTSNSLRFQYKDDKVMFTSTTSHQWLSDDMLMDQDFSEKSIFTLNQRQHQNAVSQEFAVRSVSNKNYQWSVGAYGFYTGLSTVGDVTFGADGVKTVLQDNFPPFIKINNTTIPNPGTYKTPSWGAAIFHQSTFNNLLTKGLAFTVGLRLDYERQYLDYNTQMAMDLTVSPRPDMSIPYKLSTTLTGKRSQQFLQVLPRVSLKYECTPEISTWITASKGHRAGGYNVQMFSEVSQNALQSQVPMGPKPKPMDIDSTVGYTPEITWNYEIGTRGSFFGGDLTAEAVLFYMDIRDLQLTQFIDGGSGRILTNAGRGESYGGEISVTYRPLAGFNLNASYGYTHATFKDYDSGTDKDGLKHNYAGQTIPYTPEHTFSVGASYHLSLKKSAWLSALNFSASYSGAGPIYWSEENNIIQPFYGLLDMRVAVIKDDVKLEIWGRNVLDQKYGAFYFESFDKSYLQLGRPATFGATLSFTM